MPDMIASVPSISLGVEAKIYDALRVARNSNGVYNPQRHSGGRTQSAPDFSFESEARPGIAC